MQAFKDDHHGPEALSSMSIANCAGGMAENTYPCSGVDLLAFLPLNQIGGGSGNDIWGWTDPLTGKEYAIMGRTTGTSFVDISDPVNPIYLGNLPYHANPSSWRDIKVYGDYAFLVSEAIQSGMQVFNLTELRNVVSPPVTFAEAAWYNGFLTAHNLAINEATGFAYAVGTNDCSGGLHMVDISNPTSPVFAGCFSSDGYTHDAQCVIYHGPDSQHQGKEICFNSNADTVTIVDVTNKGLPFQISRTGYAGSGYTHQGWLTEDHIHLLIDDELDETNYGHNTRTYLWDVSDLDNPVLTGFYTSGTPAIDHNQYVKGNYVYQSNYRAGLRILDISDIANTHLTEAGYFDIYPASDSPNFNGTWSNYPFFASGNIVVSGIEQGLFILRPNFDTTSTPPTVNIINPAENDTIMGSVEVQIDASDSEDPSGTLSVEWNVDGGIWQPATYNSLEELYKAIWDTTTGSSGTKTINARAVNSRFLVGFDSHGVTVFNPLPSFHVDSIEVITAPFRGPRNRGVATVTIVAELGASPLFLDGIAVSGAFSGDWNGTVSGSTNSLGEVALETPPVKDGNNWTFCVEAASKDGWTYDSSANIETCGSTGGPSIVGSVSGAVTDASTGNAIQGAIVSTDTGQNGLSNSDGDYQLTGVPTGSRTIMASASGYTSEQATADVFEGVTTTVDFDLNPTTSGGFGTIKGTVTDSTGAKLGGVLVATDTGHSAITNNGGKYTIQNVPEGDRTVTASKQGYIPDSQNVQLFAGQSVTLEFSLASQ